ncbi:hypothetical protein M3Y99_01679800 [Aphelenchoides fujianensis]|nr:hypothetical protein M3Y99_01679800 [Aphelenchoides fujianensis]
MNAVQNAQFSTPNSGIPMPPQTAGHNQTGMSPAAPYSNSHQAPPGDFYARPRPEQLHDPQQPHTWRKASCLQLPAESHHSEGLDLAADAPDERSGRRLFDVRPTDQRRFHSWSEDDGERKRAAASSEALVPPAKQREHPSASQSLSAAEFLRRHGGEGGGSAHGSHSLRRFNSQLRTHRFSTAGLNLNSASGSVYTPPPMLSPMRVGTGLYRSISRQERKISSLALSLKRMDGNAQPNVAGAKAETPTITTTAPPADSAPPSVPAKPTSTYPIDIEQARATLTGRKPFIRPPMDNRANAPQRKNGLFLSCATQGTDGSAFAAELELLRKESASSTASTNQENNPSRRMSIIRNSKLSITNDDEVLRKLSTSSTDEPTRKLSSTVGHVLRLRRAGQRHHAAHQPGQALPSEGEKVERAGGLEGGA